MNLVATVALARNFVGLLHSTIAEKSNETIKLAIVFQNSTEKITKATKLCVFCCIPLHNWLLLWRAGGNSPPSHPLITDRLPNTVWQPAIAHKNQYSSWSICEQDRNKLAHHNEEGQKGFMRRFLSMVYVYYLWCYLLNKVSATIDTGATQPLKTICDLRSGYTQKLKCPRALQEVAILLGNRTGKSCYNYGERLQNKQPGHVGRVNRLLPLQNKIACERT